MPYPDTPDTEGRFAAETPFPGNPRIYRRIAVWGSIALHAYLFLGFWAIKALFTAEKWPTSWWPLAAAILSALLFARLSFRWIMRLDAQYGRGSGWALVSTTVKLPWESVRTKPKKQ